MNVFELLILQPIFNVLMFLYGIVPGHDLGVAVILFTILVRVALWPIAKKQLHQSKLMREIQPQLAAVRKKAKGNKQLEAQMMMELYKEKGISPFGSIGLLLIQLPVFIALFSAINIFAHNRADIAKYTYDFLYAIPHIKDVVAQPDSFNHMMFGIIDLTKSALSSTGWVAVLFFVIAIATAILQFYQSKQLMPQPKDKRRLRDLLKDQAAGKQVEQTDVMAATTRQTMYIFPVLMFAIAITMVGALELYLFTTTLVGYLQQQTVLGKDTEEMEELATETPAPKTKAKNSATAKKRAETAKPAKVVQKSKRSKKKA